jgi:hypothetical protein
MYNDTIFKRTRACLLSSYFSDQFSIHSLFISHVLDVARLFLNKHRTCKIAYESVRMKCVYFIYFPTFFLQAFISLKCFKPQDLSTTIFLEKKTLFCVRVSLHGWDDTITRLYPVHCTFFLLSTNAKLIFLQLFIHKNVIRVYKKKLLTHTYYSFLQAHDLSKCFRSQSYS